MRNQGVVLELMIPPITGWVVQWENALLELGKSQVQSPVWPYLFSSYTFLLLDALPVTVVCMLSFSDELLKISRRIGPSPEVLDAVWEAVVVQAMEYTIKPT